MSEVALVKRSGPRLPVSVETHGIPGGLQKRRVASSGRQLSQFSPQSHMVQNIKEITCHSSGAQGNVVGRVVALGTCDLLLRTAHLCDGYQPVSS